ncbi:hypothetical protein TRFO_43301 [Tritrichomonas foetus]|uniref:Uncharacterized protein n=1 Tax=Tritrichomonas foetus TaxID=1144522 RepID=A0A1J4KRY8_9EUKA|nr:hypothetical protein TRFO_43301 [Tritrichomonas foetus]|eukprot:OHT13656.1 hypothetical protein TRFO_43301 [Tritrichomonas foetus]
MNLKRIPEELLPAVYDVAREACLLAALGDPPQYWQDRIDKIKEEALWYASFYIYGDRLAQWIHKQVLKKMI